MPRALIGAVVAAAIAVLTASVYLVTTARLGSRVRGEVEAQVGRAQDRLRNLATLETLKLLKEAQELAQTQSRELLAALGPVDGSPTPRRGATAFRDFRTGLSNQRAPDVLALVNRKGEVIVVFSGSEQQPVVPKMYFEGDTLKYPIIELAMAQQATISEVWDYQQSGPVMAAVSPVIDRDFTPPEVVGAVVVAYFISKSEVTKKSALLGADVAYFYGNRVFASNLDLGGMGKSLAQALFDGNLASGAMEHGTSPVESTRIGDEEYFATAVRLPRQSTRGTFPDTHSHAPAGVMILQSVTSAESSVSSVKLAILLLGFGALLVALFAVAMTAKSILGPLDEIEVGINDIINGNVDHVFEPVGRDVDGLANALNVMLARLLGRPEPGEEEYDEAGNIITISTTGTNPLPVGASMSPKDAEAMRLAEEPEDAYHDRLFREFLEAREATGESNAGITRDSFVSKLRVNESNMKKKYNCETVRFKVLTKQGKVTLKPVPIA